MQSEKQKERRLQIEKAAFQVLEEMGYRKASMLQIAKRAQASNETLYSWYGNKQSLFSTIIAENAKMVREKLEEVIADHDDSTQCLTSIGQLMLHFVATDKAVIINRAAIADVTDTGLLAEAIQKNARDAISTALANLMSQLESEGFYNFDSALIEPTDLFLGLLIGEIQIQQALGAMDPLRQDEIITRSAAAVACFDQLFKA